MINNANIDKILNLVKKQINDTQSPAIEKVSHKYNSPFHILISTMLSARTKDENTYKVSQNLYKVIKNIDDLASINIKKLEKLIFSSGFYKIKAKNLKNTAKIIKEKFNGKVPDTMEKLLILPGVGRKTANLVLILAFNKYGICVDTHVHRIVNRWNYVKTKTPEQTEFALRKILPKKHWKIINYLLVSFGKKICKPITPLCTQCKIKTYCPYPGKIKL